MPTNNPSPIPLRELDRRVAEALGWKRTEMVGEAWETPAPNTTLRIGPLPRFSADETAAFECVAHLRARGWGYMLHHAYPSGDFCSFTPPNSEPHLNGMFASAETPPLAICKAFLAVLDRYPSLATEGHQE